MKYLPLLVTGTTGPSNKSDLNIKELSPPPPLSFLVAQSSWIVPRLLSPRLENNRVFLLILSIFFSLRPHFYLR